jgi:hypothetical protein
MPVAISVYDHTLPKIAGGIFLPSHTYKVNLYSAFTFSASSTTKAAAETGATQLATQYGYTQDDKIITGWAVTQVTTNDAMLDADNVVWTVSTATLSASHAMVYNDTVVDDPPLFYINFGEVVSAPVGDEYRIVWDANGILRITV